jgi:hypothetical protein
MSVFANFRLRRRSMTQAIEDSNFKIQEDQAGQSAGSKEFILSYMLG